MKAKASESAKITFTIIMKNTRRLLLLSLFATALLAVITGCRHTAHGAGQDIEDMGEKIQEKTR